MIKSKEHLLSLVNEAQASFDRDEWDSSLDAAQALGLHVVDFLSSYYLESCGDLLDAISNLTRDRAENDMDCVLYTMVVSQILL